MRFTLSLLATASLIALASAPARAAEKVSASPSGKGTVGGVLLGAEVVCLTEAALKVEPPWAYIVGGVAGGIGGGIAGFYLEDNAHPRTSILLLAAGMALIIPTSVAVLSATAYEPPADYVQDRRPADEPVAEPPHAVGTPAPAAPPPPAPAVAPEPTGAPPATPPTEVVPPPATPAPSGSIRSHRTVRSARAGGKLGYPLRPPALIGIDPAALTLSVPAVEFRNLYTAAERAWFGVNQGTEIRVPVLNFVF
jgi:outer membrane biosynthesis protein TonB